MPQLADEDKTGLSDDGFNLDLSDGLSENSDADSIDDNDIYAQSFPDEAGLEQYQATDGIHTQQFVPEGFKTKYDTLPTGKVKLSQLKSAFDEKNVDRALGFLTRQFHVEIDKKFLINPLSRDIHLSNSANRLDFFMASSKTIGLSAGIPITQVDISFTFSLDLRKPFLSFPTKFARLGFDPYHCMLFIGSRNSEKLWLALAPDSFIEAQDDAMTEDGDEVQAGYTSGATQMLTRHCRMIQSFLIYCLSLIPSRSIPCYDKYGVEIGSGSPSWFAVTDIMYVQVQQYIELITESIVITT